MKTRNEIAQLLKDALAGQDTDAIWFAIGELEKNDADKSKSDRIDGIEYALNELREVYGEGIEDTDIWAEYMSNDTTLTHEHDAHNWTWGDGDGYTWQVGKCLACATDITRRKYANGIYTEWVVMP